MQWTEPVLWLQPTVALAGCSSTGQVLCELTFYRKEIWIQGALLFLKNLHTDWIMYMTVVWISPRVYNLVIETGGLILRKSWKATKIGKNAEM